MTQAARRLFQQALRLPAITRGKLVDGLIVSLYESPDPEVEASWGDEIARRLRLFDEGRVKAIPLSKALPRIFGKKRGRTRRR